MKSLPTLLIMKNGKEVARQAGAMSLPQFEAWLKGHI